MFFAPRILERGKVDPTKVSVQDDFTLLVAYDGTEAAWEAFKEAARSARQMDAQLVLVNIDRDEEQGIKEEQLRELSHELASDLPIKIEKRSGLPAKLIVEIAEEYQADYIYMGKHNHPAYKQVLVGETSKNVIQNTPVPVILIEKENGTGDSYIHFM